MATCTTRVHRTGREEKHFQPRILLCRSRTKDINTNSNLDSTDTLQIVSWRDLCRTTTTTQLLLLWWMVFRVILSGPGVQRAPYFFPSSPCRSKIYQTFWNILERKNFWVDHQQYSIVRVFPVAGSRRTRVHLLLLHSMRSYPIWSWHPNDPLPLASPLLRSFPSPAPLPPQSSCLVNPICSQIYRNRSNFVWKNLIRIEIFCRFVLLLLNSILVEDCHFFRLLIDWRQRAFN